MTYDIVSESNERLYKVSVVIPVYNVEDYLAETVTSVINQTLDEVEIILINDGSTDGSEAIIRHFLKKHDSIVYVKQEHAGPGAARNTGIELARGSYISFVDSDDLLPADAIEFMYTTAVHEKADIVTGASISFNSKRTWYIQSHSNKGVYHPGPKTLVSHPELLFSVGPCYKMFKGELIESIRFPVGINVTEDHPFVIEAYLKATKIFTVDKIIYKYRRRESVTNVSLSQSVRINPGNVLRDILQSISISDQLWHRYLGGEELRVYNKAYYYHRLITADIWPAIINLLRTGEAKVTGVALKRVSAWVSKMDQSVVTMLEELGCGGRLHVLKEMAALESTFPLKKRILIERAKKLYRVFIQVPKNVITRRFLYPILKKIRLKNKILFVSSKLTTIDSIDEKVRIDIQRIRPEYTLKYILDKPTSLMGLSIYLFDLATAKVIITDDYENPFQNLVKRDETEVYDRRMIKHHMKRTSI